MWPVKWKGEAFSALVYTVIGQIMPHSSSQAVASKKSLREWAYTLFIEIRDVGTGSCVSRKY